MDFDFLIFDSNLAKLNKNWVNMFQMIIIFTLESKIGFLNLGFGTYYDHCAGVPLKSCSAPIRSLEL